MIRQKLLARNYKNAAVADSAIWKVYSIRKLILTRCTICDAFKCCRPIRS